MITGLTVDATLGKELRESLLSSRPLESGAFCLLFSITRGQATRLVLGRTIPGIEQWKEQGEVQLTPSGQMISAAVSAAESVSAGLAFVHSHPFGVSEPTLSAIDERTTKQLASIFSELLDGPFASLVVGPGGWGGMVGDRNGNIEELRRIWLAGRDLKLYGRRTSHATASAELDDRQTRALGQIIQSTLTALHVGVVGAGGIGSPVAETLVRMGVGKISLIDNDVLDTPSNARRIFGLKRSDFGHDPPPSKSQAVARALNRLELGSVVAGIRGDVRNEDVKEVLLECDVIVSGTDTHSSRAAVTELCVRAGIPLVDVGARVGLRNQSQLDSLIFERRIQVPGGPCLWCWKVLDPERIRMEQMPPIERDSLEREGYVTGLNEPVPSVAALTVTAAGAATSAILALLAGSLDVGPLGISIDTITLESFPLARQTRDPECICWRWRPW